MLHHTDWETEDSVRRVQDCGGRKKLCKRMRQVKGCKGVRFEEMVWRGDLWWAEGWMEKGEKMVMMGERGFYLELRLCVQDTHGWHRNNNDCKTLSTQHSQITRISAYASLLRNLRKTDGMNIPGKNVGISWAARCCLLGSCHCFIVLTASGDALRLRECAWSVRRKERRRAQSDSGRTACLRATTRVSLCLFFFLAQEYG